MTTGTENVMFANATFLQDSAMIVGPSGKSWLLLGAVLFGVWLFFAIVRFLSGNTQHRRDLRMRRLELLAESLRDPNLDAATRNEVVRALANGPLDAFGWIWKQLRRPMLWKVLWFGSGWMLMLLCGAAVTLDWLGALRLGGPDRPAFTMMAVLGFGIVTLPLALRELLRRERVTAER